MSARCDISVRDQPLSGVLDGTTPLGNASPFDYRVLLNTSSPEYAKFSRFPGWQGLQKDERIGPNNELGDRGNRDLHDQLLQFSAFPSARREAITHHVQITSACETRQFIACTKSRIYADTGSSSNWRVIAQNLGPMPLVDEKRFGDVRFISAQLGNYILFSNDYNNVLAWRIGDEPKGDDRWSAGYVSQIAESGILRCGWICSWQGFIFLADIETTEGRFCDRVQWSDFNSPLSWLPFEESAAGYVDLGRTERIIRMEPLGGQLRCYTDKAVYNVTLVGGTEVFRFVEIYRGPLSLQYRFALVNTGDAHVYLTASGMVELKLYDSAPQEVTWVHRAGGIILNGLDGRLLRDYPGPFKAFRGLDKSKCRQITAGFDQVRREIWISWPTLDQDPCDWDGTRRMTMVMATKYRHASLIDHGFSSFCNFTPGINLLARDWMVLIGACIPAQMDEPLPLEGAPYNIPKIPDPPPQRLYNEDRKATPPVPPDPTKLPTTDSVCFLYGQQDVLIYCNKCTNDMRFSMASLTDFCLKELREELRSREVHSGSKCAAPNCEHKCAVHFTIQPQNFSAIPGQNMFFRSRAEGDGPISYQWYKNGILYPGKTDRTLILQNVSASEAGTYTVVASDGFCTATSLPAQLIVSATFDVFLGNAGPDLKPSYTVDEITGLPNAFVNPKNTSSIIGVNFEISVPVPEANHYRIIAIPTQALGTDIKFWSSGFSLPMEQLAQQLNINNRFYTLFRTYQRSAGEFSVARGSQITITQTPVRVGQLNPDLPDPDLRMTPSPPTDPKDWTLFGYETLIQSEVSLFGNEYEKLVKSLALDFAYVPDIPLHCHSQFGVAALPDCVDWWDSEPWPLGCKTAKETKGPNTRDIGPMVWPYYGTGRYLSWRVFLSKAGQTDCDYYRPIGGVLDFTRIGITINKKPSCK